MILETRHDAAVTLTLNRPERLNAIIPEMLAELRAALEAIAADNSVGAIVLTGAGRAFCAGGDADYMAGRGGVSVTDRARQLRANAETSRYLSELPKITICALNGVAAGAGMALALACDLCIAAESARMVGAFNRMGLCSDLGTAHFLRRAVGTARAKEILLLGNALHSAELLKLGLVKEVVPDIELPHRAAAIAKSIAEGPRLANALLKQVLHAAEHTAIAEWLDFEALAQATCAATSDHREAVRAFKEKRPPRFGEQ